jgi:EF hand
VIALACRLSSESTAGRDGKSHPAALEGLEETARMKKLLGISLISLLALGSVALAEAGRGPGHPRHPRHPRLDFDTIDTNKDGKVTKEEFTLDMKKRFDEHWKRMDDNGDGVLQRDELRRGPHLRGKHGDGDCDGHGKHERAGHGAAGNPG